jgi:hypothetical protein
MQSTITCELVSLMTVCMVIITQKHEDVNLAS